MLSSIYYKSKLGNQVFQKKKLQVSTSAHKWLDFNHQYLHHVDPARERCAYGFELVEDHLGVGIHGAQLFVELGEVIVFDLVGFQGERTRASTVDRINLGMDLRDLKIDTARVKNRDQPAVGDHYSGSRRKRREQCGGIEWI